MFFDRVWPICDTNLHVRASNIYGKFEADFFNFYGRAYDVHSFGYVIYVQHDGGTGSQPSGQKDGLAKLVNGRRTDYHSRTTTRRDKMMDRENDGLTELLNHGWTDSMMKTPAGG